MKQEEKTERTRQKILSAAMEEFGTNGYAGASLNAVCGAGISKGLLYHNFESKDALYLACTAQCFDALTQTLRAAEIGGDLQKYMEVRLRFFREHERQAHLFFEAILQPPEALRDKIAIQRRALDQLNLQLYETILDSLPLRDGITREDAVAYFSLMQNSFNTSFCSTAYSELSFTARMAAHEKGLKKLLDCILYGIAERRSL
ncbi:MAG: TetR/AcrR family transcriptional regulator [Faecalibacterium sp.]|nr:TetR/AcrR family transcriptional regulator [Faecalibacterium sp.]